MKFKSVSTVLVALALGMAGAVLAQPQTEDAEWKESEVPPPPAFDVSKLVRFEVSPNASLVYGVDPSTIRISTSDSVVRYVMVATSASGARNVMYEGIRCATGEFKTYARYSPEGRWNVVSNAEWRSMFGNMPSKHALRFARAGACDNASPPSTVDALVSRLKNPTYQQR